MDSQELSFTPPTIKQIRDVCHYANLYYFNDDKALNLIHEVFCCACDYSQALEMKNILKERLCAPELSDTFETMVNLIRLQFHFIDEHSNSAWMAIIIDLAMRLIRNNIEIYLDEAVQQSTSGLNKQVPLVNHQVN